MGKIIELFDDAISALNDIEDEDFDQDNGNKCILANYYIKYEKHFDNQIIDYIDEYVDDEFKTKYYRLVDYVVNYSYEIIKIKNVYLHNFPLFKGKFDKEDAISRIKFAKEEFIKYFS